MLSLPTTAAAAVSAVPSMQTSLMSTSLNSTQIQNHIAAAASANASCSGGVSTSASLSTVTPAGVLVGLHSTAGSYVPSSAMSTSLHSNSSGGVVASSGQCFDNNGTAATSWNNSPAAISPSGCSATTASAQLRKCEVKLNAMP